MLAEVPANAAVTARLVFFLVQDMDFAGWSGSLEPYPNGVGIVKSRRGASLLNSDDPDLQIVREFPVGQVTGTDRRGRSRGAGDVHVPE